MPKPKHDELVNEYRKAFTAGDAVTAHEILQFAKHDATLSAQLLAAETEILAAVPPVDIDVEHIASLVNSGGRTRRAVDHAEQWVRRHEGGVRAAFRYWPLGATLGFGLSLYGLGSTSSAPLTWWLFGIAVMCLGSIAVVCSSSLWRQFPGRKDRQPVESSISPSSSVSPPAADDGEKRIVPVIPLQRSRSYEAPLAGLALAASVAGIALLVFTRKPETEYGSASFASVVSGTETRPLLASGQFPASDRLLVPLRVRGGEPVRIAVTLHPRLAETPSWLLSVVDERGAIVAAARSDGDSAAVTVPTDATRDEVWFAFLELGGSGENAAAPEQVAWSLYGTGVEARDAVDVEGRDTSPSDLRVEWIDRLEDAVSDESPH